MIVDKARFSNLNWLKNLIFAKEVKQEQKKMHLSAELFTYTFVSFAYRAVLRMSGAFVILLLT